MDIDNPNSIHAFNRFEEEGHAERKYNHFRLIDFTREELYAMGVPAILDDDEEEQKIIIFFSEYFVSCDRIQKSFDPQRTRNKDVFCHGLFF